MKASLGPALLLLFATSVPAQQISSEFQDGPLIAGYGRVASVSSDIVIPQGTRLKVSFDIAAGNAGRLNRSLDSVARFLNMNARAGLTREQQRLAIVVHGTAALDLTKNTRYAKEYEGQSNPNVELIHKLLENGVQVQLCGQSAAARGIAKSDLLPGVEMALSAMTAHALLHQAGYSINPF